MLSNTWPFQSLLGGKPVTKSMLRSFHLWVGIGKGDNFPCNLCLGALDLLQIAHD